VAAGRLRIGGWPLRAANNHASIAAQSVDSLPGGLI
jgi:hypothetical protein